MSADLPRVLFMGPTDEDADMDHPTMFRLVRMGDPRGSRPDVLGVEFRGAADAMGAERWQAETNDGSRARVLETAVRYLEGEVQRTRMERSAADAKWLAAFDEANHLRAQLVDARNAAAALDSNLAEARGARADLRRQVEMLTADRDANRSEAERLLVERDGARRHADEMEARAQRAEAARDAERLRAEAAEAKAAGLQGQVDHADAERVKAVALAHEAKGLMAEQQGIINRLDRERTRLMAEWGAEVDALKADAARLRCPSTWQGSRCDFPTGHGWAGEVTHASIQGAMWSDHIADGSAARDTFDGAERIAVERARQMQVEGYTAEHDDDHGPGCELARAAAAYISAATPPMQRLPWPWSSATDKRPSPGASPVERIRALVKAGALCAAEVDRLLRLFPDAGKAAGS